MIVAIGVAIWIFKQVTKSNCPSKAKMSVYRLRTELGRMARISAVCAAAGCLPMVVLGILGHDFPFWIKLSAFFTKTAFITIGGSYTVLPYVAQVAVSQFSWLSHAQMLDGFALAETTPGPLIIVVGFVGFMAGLHHFEGSSLIGAISLLVTVFYTFLPCFFFVFLGAPWIAKAGESPIFREVLRLITAVVFAAILQLTLFLIRGVLFVDGWRGLRFETLALIVGPLLLIQLSSIRASRKAASATTLHTINRR